MQQWTRGGVRIERFSLDEAEYCRQKYFEESTDNNLRFSIASDCLFAHTCLARLIATSAFI